MHNYYTFLYNKAVFDLLVRERGEGEAVLFARSATVGGQQFPAHWGGDCCASYPSMAETLRSGLSLRVAGLDFGVTISVVLKIQLRLIFIKDGASLV